ncbi:MAG: hypothetical protein FJX67_04875 [Alphaproteobacteria bacterium]|nr:hypothetical protein [Alphaproteobacteria bacterium]
MPSTPLVFRWTAGIAPLHVARVRDITERQDDEARPRRHGAERARIGRRAASGERGAALAYGINQKLTAMIGVDHACQTVLRHPAAAGLAAARDRRHADHHPGPQP